METKKPLEMTAEERTEYCRALAEGEGWWQGLRQPERQSLSRLYSPGEEVKPRDRGRGKGLRPNRHRYWFVTSYRQVCGAYRLLRDDGRLCSVSTSLSLTTGAGEEGPKDS